MIIVEPLLTETKGYVSISYNQILILKIKEKCNAYNFFTNTVSQV